jgi:pimeloyl-ACP methyl ester carboxylesterase
VDLSRILARAALALLALFGTSFGQTTVDRFGDGGVPAIYKWTGDLPQAGTLLRSEPLPANLVLPEASRGERILYSSTNGLNDQDRVAVSGALFWPKGDAPAGGWPIVAWAHGTVGTADKCAPSFAGRSDRDVQYLSSWLKAGFAVVATDYQGLGTPGGHPYLAAKPEGYSVLDSVRAVRDRDGLGERALLVGQSQGAGAAFATAAVAGSYAPDVKLIGTVATGLPYFSKGTLAALARGGDPDVVTPTLVYTLLILQLAEQALPNFNPSEYLTERGRQVYDMARTACYREMANAVTSGQVSSKVALAKDPAPVLEKLFPILAYPTVRLEKPVFVGTGEVDRDVPPSMQGALVKDACAANTQVVWRRYPDLDHSGTVNASLADSLPFARSLLAGQPVASTCDPTTGTAGASPR